MSKNDDDIPPPPEDWDGHLAGGIPPWIAYPLIAFVVLMGVVGVAKSLGWI